MKSKTTAYLLWFFFGALGIHKFYLNKVGIGILYFLTLGIFGIGWLIDLFTLGGQVDTYNALYLARINGRPNSSVNNVVVNVSGSQDQNPMQTAALSVHEQLDKLNDLRIKGALTDEEYNNQKAKLLNN